MNQFETSCRIETEKAAVTEKKTSFFDAVIYSRFRRYSGDAPRKKVKIPKKNRKIRQTLSLPLHVLYKVRSK